MEALKKPKTNTQIIQQNVLLRFKELNKFLINHAQGIFIEVSNYYCELMCGIYYNIFRLYISEVSKLYEEKVRKNDTLIADDSEAAKKHSFDLTSRESILQALDKDPIIYHISLEKKLTHALEEVFRSQNKLLVDATINEYYFVLEFFNLKQHQCSYIFNAIFKKTVQYFLEWLQNTVNYSFDPLGLLLVVRINEHFKGFMMKNEVPILDFYFDKVDFVLWPRIVQILDNHITIIKQATSKGIKPGSTSVIGITKRYIELASSIYKIANDKPHAMLSMRMTQMKSAILELLRSMGDRFASDKLKMLFLLNNLDYICSELRGLRLEKLPDLVSLQGEYDQLAPLYLDSLVMQEFKSLLDVVYKYANPSGNEGNIQLAEEEKIKGVNKAYLESVGNDFALSWGKKVEALKQTIRAGIANGPAAAQLFGSLLKDVIGKYSVFGEIVRIGHPEYFKELMAQHVLMGLKSLYNSLKRESESAL
eukprot:TRINITY_DN10372_c0_g4_i1.p1 TRINITY_DN10372_c0_g4~~TRINITY_DN10372_c0_g4_i1.p1  ORF type:complete len:478 (+),score=179.91 TRINITY_DN10372_c0_g4_i1:764-2197(+)